MFKKLGIAALVVGLGWGVLSATGLKSYTSTAFSNLKTTVKGQVPLEFEIERIRNEVAQLIPEMKKHLGVIAEEMVTVENLTDEIKTKKAELQKQKDSILAMTKDLESGSKFITYDGREYSADRVREKLNRDFASYKRVEAELKSKEQLLEAKESSLAAAREQLASMKSQKQELEVAVAQLEAEMKTLRVAQTRSNYHLDDSKLSQCKATLTDIRNRLNFERKKLELEGEFGHDGIPVEKKTKKSEELIRDVRTHFGEENVKK